MVLSEVDTLWVNMAENLIKQRLAKVSHIILNKKKSNGHYQEKENGWTMGSKAEVGDFLFINCIKQK
jgi:DNA topoisomerase VI subunit A